MAEQILGHISCRIESGVLVATFLDATIQGDELADLLRQELLSALQHSGLSQVIIDFRNVTYMSSAGFRPLLSLHRKLTELRGRMIFCNLSPDTADIFVATRLISTVRSASAPFELARDLNDALGRFRHHTARQDGDCLVVTLTEAKLQGDDLADSLNDALMATISEAGARKVALDFQPVELISTACLRPLLNLRNHLQGLDGRLVLCNLHRNVSEVLTATRLIGGTGPTPLQAVADVPAALAALNA
jgi:anti-anti-sigma factor